MKKILLTLSASLCAFVFLSCQSTGAAVPKAEEEAFLQSSAQDDSGAEQNADSAVPTETENLKAQDQALAAGGEQAQNSEPAPDAAQGQDELAQNAAALEEKIPQSEFDEAALLLQGQDETQSQESAAQETEPQEGAQNQSGSKIAQAPDGSLAQKIKDSNASAAQAKSVSDKTTVSIAPTNSSERAASNSQASSGQSSGLERVTNQGNQFSSGPLIGPASDKANERQSAQGRDASADSYDYSSAKSAGGSNASAAQSSVPQTNEGIALVAPQDGAQVEETPQEQKPVPLPSRSMKLKNNQFVDIAYPGSGWIYLGEEDGGDHFIFQGRKLGNGQTTFSLRSKKPGTALLHFYKNDILTGNYIDDWIQITVGEKSAADASRVQAPSYAEVVPPKFDREKNKAQNQKAIEEAAAKKQAERQEKSQGEQAQEPAPQTAQAASASAGSNSLPQKQEAGASKPDSPSEKVQTVIQTAGQEKNDSKQKTAVAANKASDAAQASGSQKDAPARQNAAAQNGGTAQDLLERARKAYDEKRYEDALDLVQKFFDAATEDFDAGLYLEGLILEAKSSVRNIKSAIGAYDTLIKNWPQSQYWRRANERSIYLKRFYIDIR